jgi:hypothetical protein
MEGFTKRYGVHVLLWYEQHGWMYEAIARAGDQGVEACLEDRIDRNIESRMERYVSIDSLKSGIPACTGMTASNKLMA